MSKELICPECSANVRKKGFNIDVNLSYIVADDDTLEQIDEKFRDDCFICNMCGSPLCDLTDDLLELM